MASELTNYQCPACTGPLHFVGSSGKLECDYCGSTYDVAEIEKLYAEKEKESEEASKEAEQERQENPEQAAFEKEMWGEGMKAYSCPSCGAELVCDETTAATSCPYCGNPTVVPGQFSEMLRPDYILPFKLEKKAAIEALKQHYKGKFLLPKVFSKQNHIEEIKGVYVPFWLYDAEGQAQMSYEATKSNTYKQGNYRITDTRHYDVFRSGTVQFEKVPVDGSSKMPDDYMDSIEPYNYEELKEFSTAYLPGFLADKYDVNAKDAAERSFTRCKESTLRCMEDTVTGYETVTVTNENFHLEEKGYKYALMPVWLLSTKWKDKNYLFAMNGQTGKMVGDLPEDKKKKSLLFWGIAAGAALLLNLLLMKPLGGLLASFFY